MAERSISDEAVRGRTGKRWSQWFAILDRWGAAEKGHTATAKWLAVEHGLSSWWSQTVTVQHELDRGLRRKHQRPKGYEISVSRTVEASATRAFDAFSRPDDLSRWFTRGARARLEVGGAYSNRDGDRGEFLAIQRPKRIRMTWENARHAPGTVVEFTVLRAPSGKTQVSVSHQRLATVKDAEKMKEAWSWALDSFRSYLETGEPVSVESWEGERKAVRKRAPKKRAAKPALKRAAKRK